MFMSTMDGYALTGIQRIQNNAMISDYIKNIKKLKGHNPDKILD